MHILPSII